MYIWCIFAPRSTSKRHSVEVSFKPKEVVILSNTKQTLNPSCKAGIMSFWLCQQFILFFFSRLFHQNSTHLPRTRTLPGHSLGTISARTIHSVFSTHWFYLLSWSLFLLTMASYHHASPDTSNSEDLQLSPATKKSEAPSPSQPNSSLASTVVLPTNNKAIERVSDQSDNNKYTPEFLYYLYHGSAALPTKRFTFECNYSESIRCKRCSHTGHNLFHVHLCQYKNKSFTSILLVGPHGTRKTRRCWTGVEFARRIHTSHPSYGMVGQVIATVNNIESFIESRLKSWNEATVPTGTSKKDYSDDLYLL